MFKRLISATLVVNLLLTATGSIAEMEDECSSERLRVHFETVSEMNAFDDVNSPQFKALDWIYSSLKDNGNDCMPVPLQRYIFAVVVFSLGETMAVGDDIRDECNWTIPDIKVRCDNVGAILGLDIEGLKDINSAVVLPNEIGYLSTLSRLVVTKSRLSETIPSSLGRLSNLKTLDLSNNALSSTIPKELGSLTTLQRLNLDQNNLVGTMPKGICSMRSSSGGVLNEISADCSILCNCCYDRTCWTKEILDHLASLQGDTSFDDSLWQRMTACMKKESTADLDLRAVSDAAWAEFVVYGNQQKETWANNSKWIEWDPTPLQFQARDDGNSVDILINEPCNTVSSLAYYQAMISICDDESWTFNTESVRAIVSSFSLLGFGSSFYHASNDRVGQWIDSTSISLLSSIAFQSMVDSLPYKSSVNDLSPAALNHTAVEASNRVAKIVGDAKLADWMNLTDDYMGSSYTMTFGAIVATILELVLPESLATQLIETAINATMASEQTDFMLGHFLQDLRQSIKLKEIKLGSSNRLQLFLSGLGTLVKMLYAFMWQEDWIDTELLHSTKANRLGALYMPVVNSLGNMLTGFDRRDASFDKSVASVYPGDANCSAQQPHSKWHEQSANALVDLLRLANNTKYAIEGGTISIHRDVDLLQCFNENGCFNGFNFSNAPSNDTLVIAIESCLPRLSMSNPNMSVGDVGNCVMSSLSKMIDSGSDYLDICLIENECIQFTNDTALDMDILGECICKDDGVSTCAVSGDCYSLDRCLQGCNSSIPCATSCLEQSGDMSPVFAAASACGKAILDPFHSNHTAHLSACQAYENIGEADKVDRAKSVVESIVSGLPQLATCVSESCLVPALNAYLDVMRAYDCIRSCSNDYSGGFASLSDFQHTFLCSLECYSNDVT